MIAACMWVVQVPVELLRCVQLLLNGLPRTSCILYFALLDDFLIISPSNEACQHQLGITMALLAHRQHLLLQALSLIQFSWGPIYRKKSWINAGIFSQLFFVGIKVTHQEIQSLMGFLSFACAVVVPSRAFLHRVIDLILGVWKPHSLI